VSAPGPRADGDGAGIWLIRHAESTWNAERRWQGQSDPPLSPRGREQAAALAARLVALGLHAIVSSDLRRAAETASIVAARLGLALVLDPRLREHDVGAWGGLTEAEVAARWPDDLARFRSGDLDVRMGGGETRRELAVRVQAALGALRAVYAGRRLGLVTHGGVIRALDPAAATGNCALHRL
jgi:probable phosphoglycerate mutase